MARRIRVGDEVSVGISVTNRSARHVPLFTIEDQVGAFEPIVFGVDGMAGGETASAQVLRPATKRGRFTSAPFIVESAEPFGLVRSRRSIDTVVDLTVVPRWVDLQSFPLIESSYAVSDVMLERARTGTGGDFVGVREFRPGDPLRSVHWRSTARIGSLVVREFEQEVASRVGLVIAGSDHGSGADSSFEKLVSAAASIGLYASSTGHPVHLACTDADGPMFVDEPDRYDLLDSLAIAQPSDISLGPLLEGTLKRMGGGGTVVLLADMSGVSGASLGAAVQAAVAAGKHVVVVGVDPATWTQGRSQPLPFDTPAPMFVLERDRELSRCLSG
jgi:uncharacterized protein (DUF58 family)